MSERQRQRQRAKEARALFGVKAKVSEPPRAYGRTMHDEMAEERRLLAVHDPAKASGCRICGQTQPPVPEVAETRGGSAWRGQAWPGTARQGASGLGSARQGMEAGGPGEDVPGGAGRPWVTVAGWKTCSRCQPIVAGGLGTLLSELLDTPLTEHEAVEVLIRIPADSPAYFVNRWPTDVGQAERWAHVSATFVEQGRYALKAIRAQGTPRPNSYGTGCAWCGVRTSTAWTQTPWRFGKGPGAPRAAVCSECEPWVDRSGARSGHPWREHLVAAACGLRRGQMGLTFDLKAYCESDPDDRSGTAEPWAYLGALRGQMRLRVARLHPRLISLTEREERVLALQRVAEDAGKSVDAPTPLARM